MTHSYTFPKSERVCLQREIDALFQEGKSFIAYPLRVIYVEQKPESGAATAILISVPKRKLRYALDRNRMKRLIRENYRLNKHPLLDALKEKEKHLLLAFIYLESERVAYPVIESAMKKALSVLKDRLA